MIDLHIIPNEKITVSEIASYRKRFRTETNPYVVFGGQFHYDLSMLKNVTVIDENPEGAKDLLKMMKKADRIHIHGLFSFWLLGILATHKSIGKKTVWYIWGDDLYCLSRPKKSLKNMMHIFLRKRAYRNIKFIATNIRGDYENAQAIMQKKYDLFELRFCLDYISGILPVVDEIKAHEGINILVGNSATPTNFHLDVFKKLQRYQNENIRIFVPLSYGLKTYAEEVIKSGKELFGDRFVPLTDFMPKEDYFKFLMNIDIAVFANDRQQALGNIIALLYAGKKVYIRSDISSWFTLHEEYNINISDYIYIDEENFDSFIENPINIEKQRRTILDMVDEEKAKKAISATLISEEHLYS